MLVAGGGPVGLAAAVELGRRGIDCLVVEPRTSVSHARPRCKTVSVRTAEHLRRWGIVERLRERAPLPASWSNEIVFCTSLVGWELSRFRGVLGLVPDGDRYPELGQQAPQYVLEELLRDVVDELAGCTLATGLRVTGVDQDDAEVRVTITDSTGEKAVVTTDYLIGCDGPRSAVRDAISAAYTGGHALRPNFGMVFRAPSLGPLVRHGPAVQYWTINPVAPALMGPIDLEGTWWIIAFGVEEDRGRRDARAIIDAAAGTPVEAEVCSHDPWTARMQLVDRARDRRVFLAGDAAHLNPPFGGHGLNTGIGDAVDLGWKLAAVLDGWGGPRLLDSYETERRPVHTRVIEAAVANMQVLATDLVTTDLETSEEARRLADAHIQAAKTAEFHALDLVLDIAYDSPAIASGGARLPHAWLGPGRSLYDELGDGLSLLVGDGNAARAAAISDAARERRIPLRVVDLAGRRLRDRFGAALVLVRPDQHVAWRGDHPPDDASALLDRLRGAATSVMSTMDRGERFKMRIEIDGLEIASTRRDPAEASGRPLIVTLHGGLYTSRYFDVPISPGGSFVDLASRLGYPTVSFDRPSYGASAELPPEQNTFERQAELLGAAIREVAGDSGVVLIGHSIGGMIALTIAAMSDGPALLGVSATGIGAVIPQGGASEQLAAAAASSGQDVIALPHEACDPVMFGPPETFDPGVLDAAHATYSPAPAVELIAASRWAAEKLPRLAPDVRVPVHNVLAEYDALWDTTQESVEKFRALFTAAPFIDASLMRAVGHSIDHHKGGHALHLRQLAFAHECTLR